MCCWINVLYLLYDQGEKGDTGQEGDNGEKGDIGLKGKEGPSGHPGLNGFRVSLSRQRQTHLSFQRSFTECVSSKGSRREVWRIRGERQTRVQGTTKEPCLITLASFTDQKLSHYVVLYLILCVCLGCQRSSRSPRGDGHGGQDRTSRFCWAEGVQRNRGTHGKVEQWWYTHSVNLVIPQRSVQRTLRRYNSCIPHMLWYQWIDLKELLFIVSGL